MVLFYGSPAAGEFKPAISSQSVPRVDRADRKATLRSGLIEEVAHYLLKHNGPDKNGKIHPVAKKLNADVLGEAISVAESLGMPLGLRPYHCKIASTGTFKNSDVVLEVLVKKCTHLIQSKFGGDAGRFVAEVTFEDLNSPLTEHINGRAFTVSMSSIRKNFRSSPSAMVNGYLAATGQLSAWEGLRPYHAKTVPTGTYSDSNIVSEVLVKKCNQLIRSKFEGNTGRFISEVTFEDLTSPFTERINGHEFTVKMSSVADFFGRSPFEMIKGYLEAAGQLSSWEGLRPYHVKIAPSGTYKDSNVVSEVLVKKCNQLIHSKYEGDTGRFIAEVTYEDLISPLTENINGHEFTVSMNAISQIFRNSPYEMVKDYLRETGQLSDWEKDLRPYHFNFTSWGTYNDSNVASEVLVKKCNHLIDSKFGGNIGRFIAEVTAEDFESPFTERINGHEFTVSMGRICAHFRYSPYEMVKSYFEATDQYLEWEGLRPYHFSWASWGSYNDSSVVSEVLVKKCKYLIDSKFEGNIGRFIAEVTLEDLALPLIEEINGNEFTVSTRQVGHIFRNSPLEMVKGYLEATGQSSEWEGLRPYHAKIAPSGTYDDSAVLAEVLVKKCNHLIHSKFGGSIGRFIAEVSREDIASPLIERINEHEFSIATGQVCARFGHSLFEMVRCYVQASGKPFNYTRACFVGSPDTRLRRQQGNLTKYDFKVARKSDGEYDLRHFGALSFNSEEKGIVRDLVISQAIAIFGDLPVKYLGLEAEGFSSLKLFSEELNLSNSESTIVEYDKTVYSRMAAVQKHATNGLKAATQDIQLVRADINNYIATTPNRYNLINLDYVGYLSKKKAEALRSIVARNVADDITLLAITINDSERARCRAVLDGFSSDQRKSVEEILTQNATMQEWSLVPLGWTNYTGGTSGGRRTKMLFMMYELRRKAERG